MTWAGEGGSAGLREVPEGSAGGRVVPAALLSKGSEGLPRTPRLRPLLS